VYHLSLSLSAQLKKWVEDWHLTEAQLRELYHLMWETFSDSTNKS